MRSLLPPCQEKAAHPRPCGPPAPCQPLLPRSRGNKEIPSVPSCAGPGCLTCGGDAGALLGAQGRHGPAARRAHGGRRHMQLPVIVVVVSEPRSGDRRRQRGGGCHRPGVKSAVVRGAAVERVPVEAGEDDGRSAGGWQQHRILAARSARQDIVDAEHAHRHAPNRAGAGQRGPAGGRREGGTEGRWRLLRWRRGGGGVGRRGGVRLGKAGETRNRNFSEKF